MQAMPGAELVLKNARVLTMEAGRRRPRASVVAVRRGRIWQVGDEALAGEAAGPGTKVIDCQGLTLVPGFNDAHCHIFSFVRHLLCMDLSPPAVKSIEDIKALVAQKARETPPGRWIQGVDYNEFYLAEKRHPTRWDLDEVAPDHPVVLSHRSLHACVLNSRALELAGITRETPEPPGATIERRLTDGEPNGVLYEMLGFVRERVMPPWTEAELDAGMRLANQRYLSAGITSLQDATVVNDHRRFLALRRYVDAGKLRPRIYMMFGPEGWEGFRQAGLHYRDGDDRLRLGGLKVVPSSPGGQLYPPPDELARMVLEANRQGFPAAIHAVRQSTVAVVADAFETARRWLPGSNLRNRVEHCAECPPPLLERLRATGAVVVTQPVFLFHSGERYLSTVPEETLPWLYRIRAFFEAGLVVAASSDSPIAPNNPLLGIYGAVTRRTAGGRQIAPDEAVTPGEALAMYTRLAAFASQDEDVKGTISPGRLADLVLLSDDPTAVEPEAIRDIRVLMTIIGGEVVWQAALVQNDG